MINIFILNWNSADDVRGLFNSLVKSNNDKFRLLLIHNATPDENDIVKITEDFKNKFEIHLIINIDNLGYAGGNNEGLRYLQEKKIDGDLLIINPDVRFKPSTIDALIDAKKNDVGVVMIRTFNEEGKHLYDKIRLNGIISFYEKTSSIICNSDYAAGSCMLVDRCIVEEVGLFDADFFMYLEEVDLSFRIRNRGKKIISTTKSSVYRKSNNPIRVYNAIYYSVRNAFLLYHKHFDVSRLDVFFYILNIFFYSIKMAVKLCSFKPLKSFFKGVF